MDDRSTVHALLRAARGGLVRLNALIAVGDPDEDTIFQTRLRVPDRANEAERRIAEARKARSPRS